MSLRERVYGLETEYGMSFQPADTSGNAGMPEPKPLRELLVSLVTERFGMAGCEYVRNGSRVYSDDQNEVQRGHPEVSTPECRSAREVVAYDQAADSMLRAVLPDLTRALGGRGYQGRVLIAKNNVDSFEHTYGCHENYLTLRNTDTLSSTYTTVPRQLFTHFDAELLKGKVFLQYIAHCLIPYLVTRQILCGAGQFIPLGVDHPARFEISQRARFITAIHSAYSARTHTIDRRGPISLRGIVDLSREAEAAPLAGGDYFRLHLILGDANPSGWATWMKLGMTGIVLRMIEDLYLADVPTLENPIEALHAISRDPSCRTTVQLTDNRSASAVEIQRHFMEQASRYLRQFGASAEEQEILAQWRLALDDLEQDPARLANRADWAFKKQLMDEILARQGKSFADLLDSSTIAGLRAFDLRYHEVNPEGLFSRLPITATRTVVGADDITQALGKPPTFTRAAVRRDVLDLHADLRTAVRDWNRVSLADDEMPLDDPLEFGSAELFARCMHLPTSLGPGAAGLHVVAGRMVNRWLQGLQHPDPFVRARAARYLGWCSEPECAERLADAARTDPDPDVRAATLRALAQMETRSDTALRAILDCAMQRDDVGVSLVAAEAWERISAGQQAARTE